MAKNEQYYPVLRFYKGEDKNPFPQDDARNTYWSLEEIWVNQVVDNEDLSQQYLKEFDYDFPTALYEVSKTPPLLLRSFLYARYRDSGGSAKGFYTLFIDYCHRQ